MSTSRMNLKDFQWSASVVVGTSSLHKVATPLVSLQLELEPAMSEEEKLRRDPFHNANPFQQNVSAAPVTHPSPASITPVDTRKVINVELTPGELDALIAQLNSAAALLTSAEKHISAAQEAT